MHLRMTKASEGQLDSSSSSTATPKAAWVIYRYYRMFFDVLILSLYFSETILLTQVVDLKVRKHVCSQIPADKQAIGPDHFTVTWVKNRAGKQLKKSLPLRETQPTFFW